MASEKIISWVIIAFILLITVLSIIFSIVIMNKIKNNATGYYLLSHVTASISLLITIIIYFTFKARFDFGNTFCTVPLKNERCCNTETFCPCPAEIGCEANGAYQANCLNNNLFINGLTLSGVSEPGETLTLSIINDANGISGFKTYFYYDTTVPAIPPVTVSCVSMPQLEGTSVGYCYYGNSSGVCIYLDSTFITDKEHTKIFDVMQTAYVASGVGGIVSNSSEEDNSKFSINLDGDRLYFFNSKNTPILENTGISSNASLLEKSIFKEFNEIVGSDDKVIPWNKNASLVDGYLNIRLEANEKKKQSIARWNATLSLDPTVRFPAKEYPCIDPGYAYPSCSDYQTVRSDAGISMYCKDTTPAHTDCVPACYNPAYYTNGTVDPKTFEYMTGAVVETEDSGGDSVIEGEFKLADADGLKVKYTPPTKGGGGGDVAECVFTGNKDGGGGSKGGCVDPNVKPTTKTLGLTIYPPSNVMCSNRNFTASDFGPSGFMNNQLPYMYTDSTSGPSNPVTYPNMVKKSNGDVIYGFN